MSYLISNGKCIAKTQETLKSGEEVKFAFNHSGDTLVNAQIAKVSNAKKWESGERFNAYYVAVFFSGEGIYQEFILH